MSKTNQLSKATSTRGNQNVLLADQISKPLDSYFAQEVSDFTLSSPTGVSTKDTLVYTFEATAGHGIVDPVEGVNNEILLLDVVGNRSFYAEVLDVDGNTITVDRPIDHLFPVTSLGRKVITNMNVNGSGTPQIFTIRAGVIPVDITRILLTISDAGSMDDGKFGALDKLTRGLVIRIVNSFQVTIFCFKSNGEIKQFCYDGQYTPAAQGPSGQESFAARITWGGQSKHGVVLRISGTDVVQVIVQDNLEGLNTLKVAAQGHDTED